MKLSILSVFVLLISFNAFALPERHNIESAVKSVRIYQSGAQVERTFSASLELGTNVLYIVGLSPNIDPNTIQLSGAGDVNVMSVKYQMDFLSADRKPKEVFRLEDSLKSASRSLERINGLEQVYTDEMALMNANKSVAGANTGVDVDNLREVADYFRERMIELKVKMMDVHHEQKDLKETIDRLNRQLADWNVKFNKSQGTVVITLQSRQRDNVKLNLSYFTTGAAWNPSYDIRVKQLNAPVKLVYKADVMQTTGETWENVNLVLSTGNPSVSGDQPVLSPWYLDFINPMIKQRGVYNDSKRDAMPSVLMSGVEDSKEVSGMENYMVTTDQPTTVDFEITTPYTIDSDNKAVTVEIATHELPAVFQYYAAPKMDKDAFLLAKVSGWSGLNLLNGNASIYFEGNYVGQSVINPNITSDTMDLGLGRDKRIVITRELKKEFSQTKFMGSNIVKEFKYEITVKNLKKEPVTLLLTDQFPITRNGDIKININEYSGAAFDETTGQLTWRLEMAPSVTEKREIGYTIKYPKDKYIPGVQ